MLTGNNELQSRMEERRADSHRLIQELMNTRTEVLERYSQLAEQKPFDDSNSDTTFDLLTEFCELLIDYTASAHFRLYRYIDENKEKRKAVIDVANKVYPRICETTQMIVNFNDRYDPQTNDELSLQSLEKDLSDLGVEMTERIELEDRIIQAMSSGRKL